MSGAVRQAAPKGDFQCPSCAYRSKRKRRECPACGRLAPLPPKTEAAGFFSKTAAAVEFPDYLPGAVRAAEKSVFECAHCFFRTAQAPGECPACGRRKFSKTVTAEEKPTAPPRTPGGFENSEIGRYLLISGTAFFWIAFLFFVGFGSPGRQPRSAPIAALALFAAGAAFIATGLYFRSKD